MAESQKAPARPLWDRIQTICAARGWNAVRLERETGVTRQTIAKWKIAPRPPQAATVNTVAAVLDIPLEEALQLAGILPTEQRPATVDELDARVGELEREVQELRAQLRQERHRNAG